MKLSFALSVSTITAASMDEAVGDVPPPWIATTSSEAAAITAQKHRHDHHDHKIETETNGSAVYDRHHVKNNDDQYQKQPPESLPGLDDEMAPAAIAALFDNKEHASIMGSIMDSRTTTTIDSGSGDGITGDVDVDTGVLPISKRSLSSIEGAATLPIDSTRCQAGNFVYDEYGRETAESTCAPSFSNSSDSIKDYCCASSYLTDEPYSSLYYGVCAMVYNEYEVVECIGPGTTEGDAYCQSLSLDNALGSRCVDNFYLYSGEYAVVCVLCCCNSFYVSQGAPACPGQQQQCNAASTNPSNAPSAPPTSTPSASPTSAPSASPTSVPSASPTSVPITPPTEVPIAPPTAGSIARPTAGPIAKQKKTSKKSKK